MFDPEDNYCSNKPYIPAHAMITVADHQEESVLVHTSDLVLSSATPDPNQVGTRCTYSSESLSLAGDPIIHLHVIQDFQGRCRYVNEDICHSIEIEGEAPSNWYSIKVGG